jgi:hypothetical protein
MGESHEDQKKVAICGFAETWKQAPFDDPTVEVWGLNELHKYVPRWDRWFELHDETTLGVTKRDLSEGEQKRHVEWLRAQPAGKPIYMQDRFCVSGEIPAATPLPLSELIETYGRYFTSSIGYMLAMALRDGYDWIGLFGVDLASDVEYPTQRPNTEYLIGLARGMGKTVYIAPGSALLRSSHLYGYEKDPKDTGFLRATAAHKATLEQKREQAIATLNTLDGAIQECENVAKYHEYTARGAVIETY